MPKEKGLQVHKAAELSSRAFDVETTLKLEELENKEVVIEAVEERQGNYGEFVIALAHYPDGDGFFTFSTGSKVLANKLRHAKDRLLLPLQGKIVRVSSKANPKRLYWDIV